MLKYKVKLNEPKGYNEIKCDELYLSPDLSFISGVTDYSYGLVDGQHLSIEFNNDNRFHDVIVKTENVIRKGYVIFEQEFKVETSSNGEKWYRYVDGKYYETSNDNTIKKNVTYWVENNKVTIGENTYDVDIQLDKDGKEIISHYIQIKGGKQLPINNCAREYWKKVTKFYIRKNEDFDVKIDDLSCAKKIPYFLYNTDKIISVNDSSKIYDNSKVKYYLSFDKKEKDFRVTIDGKTFIQNYSKVKYTNATTTEEEIYDLEYEWRNTSNGDFLHIFLNQPQYYFTSGQKIIAESITSIITKCDVGSSSSSDENYIIYCGKKYNISTDTIDFVKIQENEYELSYTDSTHGYITLNGRDIYLKIDGTTAYKLRQHISANENDYSIIQYPYVEIEGDKFLVKSYYKDNENDTKISSVSVIRKEKFTLNIVDVISNSMLRCVPDTGDDGESSGICSVIASNHKNMIFKLENPLFNETNVDINSFVEAKNRGSEEIFDSIKIFNPSNYITFPLSIGNDMQVNINQEDVLENIFFKEEKEKSVNPYVDMEREIYYPCYFNNDGTFDLINEIKFDLHFRSRNLDDWKINEDVFEGGEKTVKCDWNIFDNYLDYSDNENDLKPSIDNNIDLEYYQPADLLYFLNFTDDDVFYQKSKISKSFLRLLFFDSNDVANQTLLYSCTVFMNENKLYKKYIDNIVKTDNTYVSVSDEINEEEVLTSTTISVYNDTCEVDSNGENPKVTFEEEKRLYATFSVKNRYESEESAEGFYLHIFKDYCEKLHDKTIYMKVEFNHAGEGRTCNFTMPFKYDEDDNIEMLDLSPNGSDLETFKKGYPLNELYEHMFIPINVVYDEINKRYSYYLPNGLAKNDDANKVMKFNLYELKIKDESYESNT